MPIVSCVVFVGTEHVETVVQTHLDDYAEEMFRVLRDLPQLSEKMPGLRVNARFVPGRIHNGHQLADRGTSIASNQSGACPLKRGPRLHVWGVGPAPLGPG